MSNVAPILARAGALATLILGLAVTPALASSIPIDDPLHGYCAGVGQCVDNGSNSPTVNPAVNFGFTISPGPQSGSEFLIDFLVPTDEAQPSGGIAVTGTYSGTATLVKLTPWSSGQLDQYLGIPASPANAIGAYLPDPFDSTAMGFFVYQVGFTGPILLQSASNPNLSPLENAGVLDEGTYIVGFLNTGTADSPTWIATANSGAILIDTPTPAPTPEPTTIALFGAGLIALSVALRRRNKKAHHSS